MRARSSTVWRNNSVEVFSRSSREEDDEEALKWAALEKLPTYNRLRKGLLTASHGAANEIDVADLGYQERQKLLERLVKVAEEDNESFLLKLKERIDRVGLDIPTIEVRYEHLKIEAEAFVGGRALPSFINSATNVIEGFLNMLHILPSRKKHVTILKDVSGKVSYNGHELNEFVPQRTAAYISQHDVHIGEMTVRETLAFSARCQGVGSRYDMLSELSRREKAANIKPDPDLDVYMKATATAGQESSIVTDYTMKDTHNLGLDYLDSRAFFTDSYWYWLGFGALIGFVLFFNVVFGFALEYLGPFDKPQAVIAEEPTNEGSPAEVELPRIETGKDGSIVESSHGKKKGMVLPFEPHSITFDEIVYSVDMPQEMKEQGVQEDKLVLLKGVSGAFRPGVLTALMGVSGAVTTTAQELSLGVDFTDLYRNSDLYRRNKQLIQELGFVVARPSIPIWWRWYYWACPVAWTLYGLVGSQFGDIMDLMEAEGNKTVKAFIEDSYGVKHDFIGVAAVVVAGIAVLFGFTFAVAIKTFNFQKR
ncbi:hypothetical protein VNO80_28125 [Phaseolus coccineus]|uniref:Plant PDR ABC transporter associated domain-containing protein n=1 Tax=Phaseolus coccineus TaxID=3886 RepID=A0AAN9LKQ1_PHACN